jgi:hypothetical protein
VKPRRLRTVLPLCGLALLHARTASACATCFGNPDSSLTQGARAGILILLGLVATVLTGIACVAAFWARRARALETREALHPAEGREAPI